IVLDKGEVVLQVPRNRFFSEQTDIMEGRLRVPEFYSIGAALCKNRGLSPRFGTADELMRLLRGKSID
ncbi:MAG: hypothetical protein ACFFFG_18570, partial [Candidatus Thorarchaeota archaeon]